MSDRVGIVGIFQTDYVRQSPVSRERITFELADGIYRSVGITKDEVDTFVFSSNDFMDGRTISECYLVQRVGAYIKDETKVEAESLNALCYATMRVLSGQYETALVLAVSMSGSEFRPLMVQNHALDPAYERPRGIVNYASAAALQADLYRARVPEFTDLRLARLAEKNYRNAVRNRRAVGWSMPPTADDVLASKPLYLPLREMHAGPYADGGCAVLIASEKRARQLTDRPIWIRGMGWSQDTYWLGERDLVGMPALRGAAAMAYKAAGVKNPSRDLSLAEIQTNFVSEEPVIAEALGLFPAGSAAKVVEEGLSTLEGKLPVNPSGGTLGGHPYNSAGLTRAVEAVRQLRGEAGPLQVQKARAAVVHSQDGVAAQHNAVVVLGN